MASKRDYDYLFKLVLIGDSGVGKVSVVPFVSANARAHANVDDAQRRSRTLSTLLHC
jgi:hypothetical protein